MTNVIFNSGFIGFLIWTRKASSTSSDRNPQHQLHGAIIHPRNRSSSPPSCHGRQGAEPTGHLCQLSRLNAELLQLVVPDGSPFSPRRHLTPEPAFLLLAPHIGESRPKVFEGERGGNVPGHDAMHDGRGQEPQPQYYLRRWTCPGRWRQPGRRCS